MVSLFLALCTGYLFGRSRGHYQAQATSLLYKYSIGCRIIKYYLFNNTGLEKYTKKEQAHS
jgi:hypothetical protein